MKIYIAYEFRGRNFDELKSRLEAISNILGQLGYKSFIFARDIQNWNPNSIKPEKIMKIAIEEMKKCDAILTISESSYNSEGLLIESGYMKALGKKLILAYKPESRYVLLKSIADSSFEFKDIKEFEEKIKKML